MAIFREFDSRGRDRAAEDRRRHRELVEESIKKNISDIIAEESIIGQSKNKKIKIPIRGIKEYRFIYGDNKPGTGSGAGNEKRGDKIGSEKDKDKSDKAGNEEGEDIYEIEVTMEELINYLFEDLDLPFMDRKKFSEIESERKKKRLGYVRKGIRPRLALKRSMVERIKRKKAYERGKRLHPEVYDEEKRFPFKEDDLRYFRLKEDKKLQSNAVVFCVMDTSGSMGTTKKYLARSFYFLLYQYLLLKYVNVEIVFIAHTTVAKEVNEKDFFHKVESGGTYISSGYEKVLEIIEERYSPSIWNLYAFHCSDGDNWREDNDKAIKAARKLCETCNLFGYGEIKQAYLSYNSTIKNEFLNKVKYPNFAVVTISRKEDIIPALRGLLEKDLEDDDSL